MNNLQREIKKINLEMENRLAENKKNYYFQLNLFKKEFCLEESYIKGEISSKQLKTIHKLKSNMKTMFTTIENKSIESLEKKYVEGEETYFLENLTLNYDKMIRCDFNNIRFKNCTFYGTTFIDCNFNNLEFYHCSFYGSAGILSATDCNFKNCTFNNCNMQNSILRQSSLNNVKFILTDLRNSIFTEVSMSKIFIVDCDFRAFKLLNHNIRSLEFEDNLLTKFDENTFFDVVNLKPKNKIYKGDEYYEDYSKFYRSISCKFSANGFLDAAGEYYYISKNIERKILKGFEKVKSFIFWILCGYGERPTYALTTSAEIILIFTLIYMFSGLNISGEIVNYKLFILKDLTNTSLIGDFMKSLYFSIVTFTTVGYGDITPIGYSVILSGLEMFLGVTMVGVWTATLARKIAR